jgi:hypothetical protein
MLRGFGRRLKNIAHDPKWSVAELVERMRTTAALAEKHAAAGAEKHAAAGAEKHARGCREARGGGCRERRAVKR